jgi:uncharacterized protein YkwD
MVDLILGAVLAFLVVRGWMRGFVKEALDLAGLVAGVILSFRLSPALGGVLSNMSGVSEDVTRFVAGIIIFLSVGIGAAFLARTLERKARLPGLNLINRAWGAGLAAAWGIFLATLIVSLLAIMPLPSAVSAQLEESSMTQTLTDPEGVPQQMFARLSGDTVMQRLISLRDAVGTGRLVVEPEDELTVPAAEPGELSVDLRAASDVYELLNKARIAAGLDPLAFSPALEAVAEGHAEEIYLTGVFSHRSATTGTVGDRLVAADVSYVVAGENLALAAGAAEIHEGLMDSEGHRANILRRDFRRVGIAVVSGPLGLMAVQVFTG